MNPENMSFEELIKYYERITILMQTPLNDDELVRLEDWAVRGYDDGEFPITKGCILRLIKEVKTLREESR